MYLVILSLLYAFLLFWVAGGYFWAGEPIIARGLKLFFGLPSEIGWTLIGAWVLLGIETVMLIGVALGFRAKVWSAGKRVYYSVLVAAGLVLVVALAALGFYIPL